MVRVLMVWTLLNGAFRIVDAQGAGKYYSGPGTTAGVSSCPISVCSYASCQPWQYLSGCTFNSSGTCTNCTLPAVAAGYYYSGTGGLNNNCAVSACLLCPPGQMNVGCGPGNMGSCVACSTPLTAGNYWTANTLTVQCVQLAQTKCSAGFYTTGANATTPGSCSPCSNVLTLPLYNYWTTPLDSLYTCAYLPQTTCNTGFKSSLVASPSTTSDGTCSPCPATGWGYYYISNSNPLSNCPTAVCDGSCPIGQFKNGCGGISAGACQSCTTASPTQVYSTNGNLTDTCQVQGCTRVCPIGQYISGCQGPASGMSCQVCTNSVPNVNYYTGMGAYNATSCPVANCPICSSGYWTKGCGNTTSGTCEFCTNT